MALTRITSAGISDGVIDVADISDNTITGAKLASDIAISTTGTITTSQVNLGDSERLRFGASQDLQIYHDGSNSYVSDQGTGSLFIQATDLILENSAGTNYLYGSSGGTVILYYNGTEKFRTASGGISVTGTVTATGNLTSLGIDDNATTTSLTISSDGRTTLDATNEKPLVVHHTDGGEVKLGFSNNAGSASYMSLDSSDFTFNQVGSETMRIDSSGNVLVSTTDTSLYNNSGAGNGGIMLANTTDGGRVDIAREGVNLIHNRLASDGIIEEFKRDGTTVGKIDANSSGISIYLGGTGSANALDDYEEGTWTPTLSNMNVSGTFSSSGRYVKVGRMVLAYGKFSATTSISFDTSGLLGGLPFAGAVTDQGTVTYERRTYNSAAGGIGIGDFISSRFFFKSSFATTSSNQETTFTAMYEANT